MSTVSTASRRPVNSSNSCTVRLVTGTTDTGGGPAPWLAFASEPPCPQPANKRSIQRADSQNTRNHGAIIESSKTDGRADSAHTRRLSRLNRTHKLMYLLQKYCHIFNDLIWSANFG